MTAPVEAEKGATLADLITPAFQQQAEALKLDAKTTQALWLAAMSLTLTPESVLQFAGGAKVRARDFEHGLRQNLNGETVYEKDVSPLLDATVAVAVERRFPASMKWVRNEVATDKGAVWYSQDDAVWYLDGAKSAQPFVSASAAAAFCDATETADALYTRIAALRQTPTVKVEADDPRVAVAL